MNALYYSESDRFRRRLYETHREFLENKDVLKFFRRDETRTTIVTNSLSILGCADTMTDIEMEFLEELNKQLTRVRGVYERSKNVEVVVDDSDNDPEIVDPVVVVRKIKWRMPRRIPFPPRRERVAQSQPARVELIPQLNRPPPSLPMQAIHIPPPAISSQMLPVNLNHPPPHIVNQIILVPPHPPPNMPHNFNRPPFSHPHVQRAPGDIHPRFRHPSHAPRTYGPRNNFTRPRGPFKSSGIKAPLTYGEHKKREEQKKAIQALRRKKIEEANRAYDIPSAQSEPTKESQTKPQNPSSPVTNAKPPQLPHNYSPLSSLARKSIPISKPARPSTVPQKTIVRPIEQKSNETHDPNTSNIVATTSRLQITREKAVFAPPAVVIPARNDDDYDDDADTICNEDARVMEADLVQTQKEESPPKEIDAAKEVKNEMKKEPESEADDASISSNNTSLGGEAEHEVVNAPTEAPTQAIVKIEHKSEPEEQHEEQAEAEDVKMKEEPMDDDSLHNSAQEADTESYEETNSSRSANESFYRELEAMFKSKEFIDLVKVSNPTTLGTEEMLTSAEKVTSWMESMPSPNYDQPPDSPLTFGEVCQASEDIFEDDNVSIIPYQPSSQVDSQYSI